MRFSTEGGTGGYEFPDGFVSGVGSDAGESDVVSEKETELTELQDGSVGPHVPPLL